MKAYKRFSDTADGPLLVLAVLWLPVLIIPLVTQPAPALADSLDAVDYAVWAIFVVEYLVKLGLAPNRWRFVRTHLVDLLVIAVPFLRPLRLARLLRLLLLARVVSVLGNVLRRARSILTHQGLHFVLLSVVLIVFAAPLSSSGSRATRYVELIDVAKTFGGVGSTDLILAPSEAVFLMVTAASLVEARRGPGTYQGLSTGLSVPVGSLGGHAVRYHVGASKGHYVAGPDVAHIIDTGTVHVTNQRVVFQGTKQTRECPYAKLVGIQHDDVEGTTVLSVSNRQKPISIHYGSGAAAQFDFRLDLGLAHFHGTVDQLVVSLQQDLATIEAQRPVPAAL